MLLLIFWRAAVITKIVAASHFASTRVIERFPFLFSWIAATILRSLVLMFSGWPRHDIYTVTTPLILALEFSAIVEIFYQATLRHKFGRIGTLMLALAALAGTGCFLISRLTFLPPITYGVYWSALVERHAAAGMVAVLAITLALLEFFRRDLPPDRLAYRAVVLMLAYTAGELIITSLQVGTQFRYSLLTNWLPVIFDGGMSALWGTWFLAARGHAAVSLHAPAPLALATGAVRMDQREMALRRAVAAMR